MGIFGFFLGFFYGGMLIIRAKTRIIVNHLRKRCEKWGKIALKLEEIGLFLEEIEGNWTLLDRHSQKTCAFDAKFQTETIFLDYGVVS